MVVNEIIYHILPDLDVVGPDLLLETKALELAVDGSQILNNGYGLGLDFTDDY